MLYLENIQFPNEERRVYPYALLYDKGLEHIECAPITILYGNNGSGKSTILNMIAERLDVRNKTLGNTNEYFNGCVRKCTVTLGINGIPADSMMISIKGARIYDLDNSPVWQREWYELENMKAYYQLFKMYEAEFEQ